MSVIAHYSGETPFEDAAAAGYTTEGWYFWDETEAHCLGPWVSQEAAEAQLKAYAEWLNQPKDAPETVLVDEISLGTTMEELVAKVETSGPGIPREGNVLSGARARVMIHGVEVKQFENITFDCWGTDPNASSFDWVETPESSNIKRFRYEAPGRNLYVDFVNGSEYVYYKVHADKAWALRQAHTEAQSVGKLLSKSIQRCKPPYEFKNLALEDGSDL